jgi:hypothetical protein
VRKIPDGQVRKYKVGDIFEARGVSGPYEIISADGCFDIKVRFINTGSFVTTRASAAIRGKVEDPLAKTVLGIGYRGVGPYSTTGKDGNQHTAYKRWANMIRRCYDTGHKAYSDYGAKGVYVNPLWHNLQNYCAWYYSNCPSDDFRIDKDLLVFGNKEYGPEFCRAVPVRINNLFLDKFSVRSAHGMGVKKSGVGTYVASIKRGDVTTILGRASDPMEAHRFWQLAKIEHLKTEIGIYYESPEFLEELREPLAAKWQVIQEDYDNYRYTEKV